MRFLVTGGCGFIGSQLVQSLTKDAHEVVVLDNLSVGSDKALPAGTALVRADLEAAPNFELLHSVDGVFHLAAVSSVESAERNPDEAWRVNVAGTRAVLDLAAAANAPLVMASSAAVYGRAQSAALSEDSALRPLGVYGQSKLAAEEVAAEAFSFNNTPSASIRLFNVYGPWRLPELAPQSVIATFAKQMLDGRRITIQGDGRQQRDFIYIEDVVALLRLAMASLRRSPRHFVVNGCSGIGTCIEDLADELSALSLHPLTRVHVGARPVDISYSVGDPARARQLLGFHPKIGLEDGLCRLLAAISPSLTKES